MFLKLFLQKLRNFYLVLERAKSDCSQKDLQAYLNHLKIEPILSKFSLSLLQMSILLGHFLANLRTVVTQNCLTGFFFNLLKTPSTTLMTFMFKWMSVTKAQVSQISSEILNGSGSRDLQKQVREKNWGDTLSSKYLWALRPSGLSNFIRIFEWKWFERLAETSEGKKLGGYT